jgi:hypothetical protein
MSHPKRSPDIPALIEVLDRHGAQYIVVGSVVAMLKGVELTPGDFDVVPATDPENLERLADALREIEARPPGPFGHWIWLEEKSRWKWIARETTQAEVDAWQPDPAKIRTFDNLYTTKHGDLDVVPKIAGTFEELLPRAEKVQAFGAEVLVAHFDEVLSRIEKVQRKKDEDRLGPMRAVREREAKKGGS